MAGAARAAGPPVSKPQNRDESISFARSSKAALSKTVRVQLLFYIGRLVRTDGTKPCWSFLFGTSSNTNSGLR